jgi:Ser/Thr protein kinase RdoA (MazF antagonist)
VLFDAGDNSVCVIDLDTVMAGYFISDVGDMLRTYLSPYGEEEQDLSKIQIRENYFDAIVRGYLSEMHTELTQAEKNAFVFAGKFLVYMQAVRFLTDYLNNDVYYGARYEGHNLVRAQNQAMLLQRLCERESVLQAIVVNAAFKP